MFAVMEPRVHGVFSKQSHPRLRVELKYCIVLTQQQEGVTTKDVTSTKLPVAEQFWLDPFCL